MGDFPGAGPILGPPGVILSHSNGVGKGLTPFSGVYTTWLRSARVESRPKWWALSAGFADFFARALGVLAGPSHCGPNGHETRLLHSQAKPCDAKRKRARSQGRHRRGGRAEYCSDHRSGARLFVIVGHFGVVCVLRGACCLPVARGVRRVGALKG